VKRRGNKPIAYLLAFSVSNFISIFDVLERQKIFLIGLISRFLRTAKNRQTVETQRKTGESLKFLGFVFWRGRRDLNPTSNR
jgi:hypothetical protein